MEQYLQPGVPSVNQTDDTLIKAMRYAVLEGGKRLRPLLCCATALDISGQYQTALSASCAIEFIHAYSLVHDDLPCMDDDALRRGKPTCHVKFGEATAVLAGDALQTLAFEIIANDTGLEPGTRLALIESIAKGSGMQGMVEGQIIDMESTGTSITVKQLEYLHSKKTGALINAAISTGAICCNADPLTHKLLDRFGKKLGLAFQVVDDILDQTQTSKVLGKQAGADVIQGKSTFPQLMGLAAAQDYAQKLEQECLTILVELNLSQGYMAALTHRVIHRSF